MRISLRSVLLSLLTCGALLSPAAKAQENNDQAPAYRNPKLAIPDRVADLLSRMTLEEKVSQIAPDRGQDIHLIDPTGTFTDESARQLLSRWWDQNLEFQPRKAAILRNGIQRYLREKTRLGIP